MGSPSQKNTGLPHVGPTRCTTPLAGARMVELDRLHRQEPFLRERRDPQNVASRLNPQPAIDMLHGYIPPHRFLSYLSWVDIDALPDRANTVIVLPCGAIEQHGPHLPCS